MKTKWIRISQSQYVPNHYDVEVSKEGDGGRYLNVDYGTLLERVMDFIIDAKEENEKYRRRER